uniref:Uncharacterized protein n=1 Tax=Arundo donax TaxID=35708 RepID=A0A0A9A5C0_ARUDO
MLRSLLLVDLVRASDMMRLQMREFSVFHIFVGESKTPLLPSDTRKAAYLVVIRTVCTSNS